MTKKYRIERTHPQPKIEIPRKLLDCIHRCERELQKNKDRSCVPAAARLTGIQNCWKALNRQDPTDRRKDYLYASIGLGFDRGYMTCRENRLRWIDMSSIHHLYDQYERDFDSAHIDWSEWTRKEELKKMPVWEDFLRREVEERQVPDPDSFLQGWCMGVHRFFMNICMLIECPEPDQNLN